MGYETILYQTDDRVALVTLNRPQRMNAFSQKLCAEVIDAVGTADRDPEVRVLIITGAGGRAFSAGYDMQESAERPKPSFAEWRDHLQSELQYTGSVWHCSKPVIAMISGYCLAGALEFAQMCDIRYASEDSRFGAVETRFSSGLSTLIMPWILGGRCRRLIYSGDTIDAPEAYRLGLIDGIFPKDRLEVETMKLAKRMSRVALAALQWNKRAINHTFETMGLHSTLHYGVEACAMLAGTRTPESEAWDDIRRSKGLQEAMKWRAAQFAPFE